MKPARTPDQQRPMRADARRNYDRLVATARVAFQEQGADASLDDIAKRAGVGSGTLYRHFPHRDALLAAVIGDSIDALHARSRELLATDDPAAALEAWMRATITHAGTYRGLAATLMSSMYDEGSPLHSSCKRAHAAGAELLKRAQESDRVRPEVDAADLFRLITAVAWAAEQSPESEDTAERLLPLVFDGLRTTGTARQARQARQAKPAPQD
ncbi:TetR/AcrR family transcriptional regulator [Streptomyces yunnanensis]|uniref:Transcriptional regulator, TetR family n=1 Tax=Streptomyces yunnanensis TaxID=156453 RepID=A0A9X8QYS2_9ACTN|nr:TetR/AcrR family transcriptional regulator [Streptomyces yunnanensis]SHN13125.1 transcriptional regulator, TetR family [Streptomyces yunnanensis]